MFRNPFKRQPDLKERLEQIDRDIKAYAEAQKKIALYNNPAVVEWWNMVKDYLNSMKLDVANVAFSTSGQNINADFMFGCTATIDKLLILPETIRNENEAYLTEAIEKKKAEKESAVDENRLFEAEP